MFFRDVLFLSQPLKRERDMSELVSNDNHYYHLYKNKSIHPANLQILIAITIILFRFFPPCRWIFGGW